MRLPVKPGLVATAAVAVTIPTAILLVEHLPRVDDRGDLPPAIVEVGITHDLARLDVATVIGPTGSRRPPGAPAAAPVAPAAVTPDPAAVASRVAAGFGVFGDGRAPPAAAPSLLPPVPAVAIPAVAPDLPPGVGLPAGDAEEPPPVTAALAPEASRDAVPAPKPALPEQRRLPVGGAAFGRSVADYRAMVAREAATQQVPAKLAEALVEIESGFDPRRRGEDGRVGLTQVSYRIAAALGYKGSARDLADPETNIRWGMRYIAGAWRRADGDLCRAAMKFKGGHYVEKPTALHAAYCEKVKRVMGSATL